jgi:hypothetical protein
MPTDNISTPLVLDMMNGRHNVTVHNTVEAEAKVPVRDLSQRQRIIHTENQLIYAVQRWSPNLIHVRDARRAYLSDAWDPETKRERDSQRLPSTEDNIFAEKVDILTGMEKDNRRDLLLDAKGRDDEKRADIFNAILQDTAATNDDDINEVFQYFRNGVMVSREHREYQWDEDRDFLGELRAVYRPADEVLIDPDWTTYDATVNTNARYRIHMQWVRPDELKTMFAHKNIDWVQLDAVPPKSKGGYDEYSNVMVENEDDNYAFPSSRRPDLFWKDQTFIRLIRIWRYEWRPTFRVIDLAANDPDKVFIGDFMSQGEVDVLRAQFILENRDVRGLTVRKLNTRRCSYQVTSGNMELEWKHDIGKYWPWDDFFSIYVNGRTVGFWNRISDPQKWLNFINSKLVERVGRLGHQVTVWREDSFVNNIDVDTIMRDGGKIEVKKHVWDKTPNGQQPFHTVRDPSLESIGPLIQWQSAIKDAAKVASNIGDIQSGKAPGSVNAASALAILQQEAARGLSVFGANMSMTRRIGSFVRLMMYYERWRKEPNVVKMKVYAILDSAMMDESNPDLQNFLIDKMLLSSGFNIDDLMRSIPQVKSNFTETNNSNNLLVRTLKMNELTLMRQQFGMPINPMMLPDLTSSFSARERALLRKGIQQAQQNPALDPSSFGKAGGQGAQGLNAAAGQIGNPLQGAS